MPVTDTMTTAEAAERLRRSPRTIARMVESGLLTPVLKLPGKRGAYLFSRREVDRALREQQQARAS